MLKRRIKLKARIKENTFEMAGTEGTKEYVVVVATARGRVGIRVLEGSIDSLSSVDFVRIRVEPVAGNPALNKIAATLRSESGWKQPGDGDQRRFSTVADSPLVKVLLIQALTAIGVAGGLVCKMNPEAPQWMADFVQEVSMGGSPASASTASTETEAASPA